MARPATRRSEFSFGLYRIVIGRFFTCVGGWRPCVETPAAAQITVSTVHKAKGLEWPRVLMSSDFNQFVELEKGNPVIDMEEACIMYVALTRAREKLILSPACVEAISASADTKAGSAPTQDSRGAKNTVQLR
jgi:ATP-dependent exoDNAse (exonuclease V) beta subunit